VSSEDKGLVPLAQPHVLVAGHQGTVALARDSGVIWYRELYIDEVFMKHLVFATELESATSDVNL
jgi:photosystem II stability/assembly factor-like uncharacterized protein